MDSRMAQESLRRYVLRVLRVWRSWFIFSDDFLNGLQVGGNSRPVTASAFSAGCANAHHLWSLVTGARCGHAPALMVYVAQVCPEQLNVFTTSEHCEHRRQFRFPSRSLHACHVSSDWTAVVCNLDVAEVVSTALSLQAAFLRGPAAALGEEDAGVAAELEALPDEALEMRCWRTGLSKRGGRAAQISRSGGLAESRLMGHAYSDPELLLDTMRAQPTLLAAEMTGATAFMLPQCCCC